jgi:hypothetical protein
MSQAALDLALRLARREPRIERGIGEQGVSQGVEPDRLVQFPQLGRGSKGRDALLIGVNLASADRPSEENPDLAVAVAGCPNSFTLALDRSASFLPIVGRTQAERRPAGNLEGGGMPSQFDTRSTVKCKATPCADSLTPGRAR